MDIETSWNLIVNLVSIIASLTMVALILVKSGLGSSKSPNNSNGNGSSKISHDELKSESSSLHNRINRMQEDCVDKHRNIDIFMGRVEQQLKNVDNTLNRLDNTMQEHINK